MTGAGALTSAVLTADEVAKLLRISRYSVYEAVRRKELPHVRIGRRILFSEDAIRRFLQCEGA